MMLGVQKFRLLLLLTVSLVFSSSVKAGSNSYIRLSAEANGEAKLSNGDVNVTFDAEGLNLTSTRELKWESSQGSSLAFEEQKDTGKPTYRLKAPTIAEYLPKATKINTFGKKIVVEIDKEVLPVHYSAKLTEASKTKEAESLVSMAGMSSKKIAATVGAALLCLAAGLFVLKKKGTNVKWLKSFTASTRYKKAPLIETVATHSIGPKRQVVVLRACGEYLLIGCAGDSMTLLTRIDEQSVEEENDLLEEEILRKRVAHA